jgi:hypothetical protein
MRVGLLYSGNDSDWIWGSAVTTFSLAKAFERLGHRTWRNSVTETVDWRSVLAEPTDLLILEGVAEREVPALVWSRCAVKIFWWLSELHYDAASLAASGFDAVATNSPGGADELIRAGVPAAVIDLGADPTLAVAAPRREYEDFAVYLGSYPHKTDEQLELVLRPATRFGLSIWGSGWENSGFRNWYRGHLPLHDIGPLYRSATVVLALTEERQKRRGMINNRIYEALAAGAIVLSDPHEPLQLHELGASICFVENRGQATDLLEAIRRNPQPWKARSAAGQRLVLERHHYRTRADAFLTLFSLAAATRGYRQRAPRCEM